MYANFVSEFQTSSLARFVYVPMYTQVELFGIKTFFSTNSKNIDLFLEDKLDILLERKIANNSFLSKINRNFSWFSWRGNCWCHLFFSMSHSNKEQYYGKNLHWMFLCFFMRDEFQHDINWLFSRHWEWICFLCRFYHVFGYSLRAFESSKWKICRNSLIIFENRYSKIHIQSKFSSKWYKTSLWLCRQQCGFGN